jgi:MYXO-CTERM domain-containing protein
MLGLRYGRRVWRRAFGCALGVGAVVALSPVSADAHFILKTPGSWMSQDGAGAPEKLGPCGDEPGGTPTGTVTAFQSGQTITVTVEEVIYHPGHYRIALAQNDRSQLPPEPTVTADANSPCGSVPVQSPAVYPVLADGIFDHSMPFTTAQSVQVTLPSNVTCTKCTLQVIEFMHDHPLNNPGGCFYHHCADISLQSSPVDGGSGAGGGGGGGGAGGSGGGGGGGGGTDGGSAGANPSSSSSGCACSVGEHGASGTGLASLFAVAMSMLRRRRR